MKTSQTSKINRLSRASMTLTMLSAFLLASLVSVSAQQVRLQSVMTGSYQLTRTGPGMGSAAIVPKPSLIATKAALQSLVEAIPSTLPSAERRGGEREENPDLIREYQLDFAKFFAVLIVQDESRMGPLRFDSVVVRGKTVVLKTGLLSRGPESREVDLGFYTLFVFNRVATMDNSLAYENKVVQISEYRFLEEDQATGFYGIKSNKTEDWLVKPVWLMAMDFDEWNHAAVLTQDRGFVLIDWDGKIKFEIFNYDNGPDYFSGGLARYVDGKKMGYFDFTGQVAIKAAWDFVLPFEEGKATVIIGGSMKRENEHSFWTGGKRSLINNAGLATK